MDNCSIINHDGSFESLSDMPLSGDNKFNINLDIYIVVRKESLYLIQKNSFLTKYTVEGAEDNWYQLISVSFNCYNQTMIIFYQNENGDRFIDEVDLPKIESNVPLIRKTIYKADGIDHVLFARNQIVTLGNKIGIYPDLEVPHYASFLIHTRDYEENLERSRSLLPHNMEVLDIEYHSNAAHYIYSDAMGTLWGFRNNLKNISEPFIKKDQTKNIRFFDFDLVPHGDEYSERICWLNYEEKSHSINLYCMRYYGDQVSCLQHIYGNLSYNTKNFNVNKGLFYWMEKKQYESSYSIYYKQDWETPVRVEGFPKFKDENTVATLIKGSC